MLSDWFVGGLIHPDLYFWAFVILCNQVTQGEGKICPKGKRSTAELGANTDANHTCGNLF